MREREVEVEVMGIERGIEKKKSNQSINVPLSCTRSPAGASSCAGLSPLELASDSRTPREEWTETSGP